MISPLIMSQLFPACFSRINKFKLLHNSVGSDGKDFVEIPEAEIIKPVALSNLISDLSGVDLLPVFSTSKYISSA